VPRRRVGLRQIGLTQDRAGDGECVDRVRLAEAAGAPARFAHELWRHAHDSLPTADQKAFERPRDVAAVLEREHTLIVERARPLDQLRVAFGASRNCQLAFELTELRGHDDGGVGLLVRVDTDYDHLIPFRICRWKADRQRTCLTGGF
jgi:hypothetical protein